MPGKTPNSMRCVRCKVFELNSGIEQSKQEEEVIFSGVLKSSMSVL